MSRLLTAPAPTSSIPLRRVQGLAGAVLAAALALRPPAPAFLYDATLYFGGARALMGSGGVVEEGGLELRGALTPLLYLPAATVSRVVDEGTAGAAVLLQNAVLIAFIGVVLIPRLVALLGGEPAEPGDSATETRFALPLVLLGIAGCAVLVADGPRAPRTTSARTWVAGTVVVLAVLLGLGVSGMGHPFEGNRPTLEQCASS